MNDEEKTDRKRAEPPTFAAQDVRQGEIILKRPGNGWFSWAAWRRWFS
ncbi:hypothetical protein [Rhizobium sp. BR 362]